MSFSGFVTIHLSATRQTWTSLLSISPPPTHSPTVGWLGTELCARAKQVIYANDNQTRRLYVPDNRSCLIMPYINISSDTHTNAHGYHTHSTTFVHCLLLSRSLRFHFTSQVFIFHRNFVTSTFRRIWIESSEYVRNCRDITLWPIIVIRTVYKEIIDIRTKGAINL